jgi:predicted permease
MLHLFASLWPLFALILGGYACRRMKFPNEEFWPGAERLNYFVLFPALLFKNLATAPLKNPALPRVVLCVGLVLGLSWLALSVLRRGFGWKAERFGVFVQGTLRFNTYIGLAAIGRVFGNDGLTLVALLLAVTVPAVNVLSVYAFTSETSVRPTGLALTILRNPLIAACLLGVIANLLGIQLLGGTDSFLSFLATTSLPLGLLCVGAALQPQELRGETTALLANSISRLAIVPALAYFLARLLWLPAMESAILVLFFALPSAPTGYVLARQLGGDARLMAGIITLQTLLSALSLPLVMRIAM